MSEREGKWLPWQSRPDFMRDHIFEPLGMKDTGFFVPAEKRARSAVNYGAKPDANGGELAGKRILSPETVTLMSSNHLPAALLNGQFGIGQAVMRPGFGYGFNVAVAFNPAEAGMSDGQGMFFWDGAAGTWFWVDPSK